MRPCRSCDDVLQQVVRHRPRRRHVLDLQRDGVGLEHTHPDRQDPLPVLVAEDDDRHVGDRIDHQALDRHFNLHELPPALHPAGARYTASPSRLFGFAPVIRTGTIRPTHAGIAREVHDRIARRPARQLPVAAPARRVDQHRLDPADRRLEQLSLDRPLQRLQRHDPARLLVLGHVVGHPLQRQRVRPRRVLERDTCCGSGPPRSATASRSKSAVGLAREADDHIGR